jgi:hypothetical protein
LKRVASLLLSAALVGGTVVAGGGVASADSRVQSVASAPQVDPIGEQKAMCTAYNQKQACESLMENSEMTSLVKNCLVKAGIAGAGALVIGRYISKDVAEDLASKVVVTGATACLSSLA